MSKPFDGNEINKLLRNVRVNTFLNIELKVLDEERHKLSGYSECIASK